MRRPVGEDGHHLLRSRFRASVLRPQDHLVLSVSGTGLLPDVDEAGVPRLVPDERDGSRPSLVVTFPPQHVYEQAFQEHAAGGAPEDPALPAGARFAFPSRLAYDVPPGEAIELTTEGLLAAMARLPLRVVPLAVPRFEWQLRAPALDLPVPVRAAAPLSGRALVLARAQASRTLAAEGAPDLLRQLPADTRRAVADLPADERLALGRSLAQAFVDRDLLVELIARREPRPPDAGETAIEVPSRLQLSPSARAGWAHARRVDQGRGDGTGPVELWHTRLGVRQPQPDGTVVVSETDTAQRVVRGVWTRDLQSTWDGPRAADGDPFTTSTSATDRIQIVGQSSGVGLPARQVANPVDVRRLHLSSLGAFIDVRGAWSAREPDFSLEEWQHRTTVGRDQYVKVVHAGYLYCFGHRVSYVKETRRKVDPRLPDGGANAILWQRHFLIVREPTRYFGGRDMPFSSVTVTPATSPDLDEPQNLAGPASADPPHLFWPTVSGQPFRFTVTVVDRNGETHVFPAPLLFVRAPMQAEVAPKVLQAYGLAKDPAFKHTAPGDAKVELALHGAQIAMAPSGPSGNARFETRVLRFAADPGTWASTPSLLFADLVVPAVAALTGSKDPLRLTYAPAYVASGFDGAANRGEVVLATARDAPQGGVKFGRTDGSGGFLNPSQKVDGVSRSKGPVADVATSAAGGQVDPASYFAGLGKLFGLFELGDILQKLAPGEVPAYAARILDLASALDGHVSRVAALLPASPERSALEAAAQAVDDLVAAPPADVPSTTAALQPLVADLAARVAAAAGSAGMAALGPAPRALAQRALDTLSTLVADAGQAAGMLAHLAHGEPVAQALSHVHLEWSPRLKPWPAGAPIFSAPENGLLLAVDARGGDLAGSPSVDVLAQLSDFTLHLVPGAALLDIHFQRLLFRAGTARKAEVDVVLGDLEWKGILGFVQRLKDLIPLDGFSDPPAIEVSATGITAGFSLALPNLAVGVFNLSNLSLAADLGVPFVGDAPTVGFAFCSRERPFTLAVMFLGGGGFFGLRLNPKGVVLLEASLEFGACLALDFGVASGSVSVMAGVYLRLEAAKGSLTGYLRIRGEVDVLGLISASIEMYMGLTYEFGSGKVVGRATITVEVEVLFFSGSVSISCERKFAGSAGDPTFADAMGPYADDGPWVEYCRSFLGGA